MSATTGMWAELMWTNSADYSALNSFTSEASLLGGVNDQPVIPALFFLNRLGRGRVVELIAQGVFGTTGTPTYTFQWRLGTTLGSTFLSGASVGVSKAITTNNNAAAVYWESRLTLTCYTPGLGSTNCTLSGAGYVASPAGFNAPYFYALEPTTPETATWTSTIDASATQYVNLSVTSSANSASNTLTLKSLRMIGWN